MSSQQDTQALDDLRDVLLMSTPQQRWDWLMEAMDFGLATARARGQRGLVTLDPHGEIMWSGLHERLWNNGRQRPSEAQLAALNKALRSSAS